MSAPSAASPYGPLYRIGRIPEPWAWTDWEYAGDQRWDDAGSDFRTVYAAESAFACLVEVLAHFRPDPALVSELGVIRVDAEDVDQFPTRPPGEVPISWVDTRRLSTAIVTGTYCDVTAAVTIAALRPIFLPLSTALGLPDFDAAAIKTARPREMTQAMATWLYARAAPEGGLWDGVAFASRHGDDLRMWAIFERPGDRPISRKLAILTESAVVFSSRQHETHLSCGRRMCTIR